MSLVALTKISGIIAATMMSNIVIQTPKSEHTCTITP